MTKEACINANGQPTITYTGQKPPNLVRYYPNPRRNPTGVVFIYEKGFFCVVVYFDKNDKCEYIHIAYT
jgi:hypothetical protein